MSLDEQLQLNQIGQLPFNLDQQDDLTQRIQNQFDYLNQNSDILVDKLIELRDQCYTVNTQIEQITFRDINQNITALIEKVELNLQDSEQCLLMAVLGDLILKFSNRVPFPFSIQSLREYVTDDNIINVKTTGLPYTSAETLAFMLILERLYEIRPSYKDTFIDRVEVNKPDSLKFKSLTEDDVWFTQAQVLNEQSMQYSFMAIPFEVRQQLTQKDHLEVVQDQSHYQEVEYQPWYGTQRYDIVDHVLAMEEEKYKQAQRSAVQDAALRAQQPFLTSTMKDIEKNFDGPPKYLNQRDSPLEIPVEIIKSFLTTVDQDMDDRISAQELYQYAQRKYLPFSETTVIDMFKEASSGRGVVHQQQKEAPLTLEEICAAVRGRHRWNTQTKVWEVNYRPFRDYWIIFLQTINERIFAMPVPKVAPTKILAQFEEEDLKRTVQVTRVEGLDKKYLSIKDKREPTYKKEQNKQEGGINPEGTMRVADKKVKKQDHNPYDQQINARLSGSESTDNGFPKVTFEAKEFYNQASILSQVIPHWRSDKENPIYHYVPTTERPFTNDSDAMYNSQMQQKMMYQSMREQRLSELQHKERTLQLAGTMALKSRKTSPWRVMKERQGFVTKFKVPTILDQKMDSQKTAKNQIDARTGDFKPIQDPYNPPSDHKFRDLELNKGVKDFTLRYKCPPPYNQNGMSEHDTRPKEVIERQRRNDDREKQRRKLEYDSILKGKPLESKKDWIQYHSLPDKLTPVALTFKDKHSQAQKEKNVFLDKEEFTPAYLQLARQMKDDVVFGKPNFNLYFKSLKPVDLNEEFGGMKTKPFKVIY